MLFIFCTHSIWFSAFICSVTLSRLAYSLYQLKKEGLCFFLYISEMGMELAGSEQIIVQDFMMLL